jgi:hypothetical protein
MHRIVLLVLLACGHLHGMEYRVVQSATYNKQKNFTKLVHELAEQANKTTEYIATQFGTPIAKQYIDLLNELTRALSGNPFFKSRSIHEIIADGVDLNYTSDNHLPVLFCVIELGARPQTLTILSFLLRNGADIHITHPQEGTILDYAYKILFKVYVCFGSEQRKTTEDIFRFLIKIYCRSLSKDERKEIKGHYKEALLPKEDCSYLEMVIEKKELQRQLKKQKNS